MTRAAELAAATARIQQSVTAQQGGHREAGAPADQWRALGLASAFAAEMQDLAECLSEGKDWRARWTETQDLARWFADSPMPE